MAKLEVFDLLGRRIKSILKDIGTKKNEFTINGEQLNSGVYFYHLFINDSWVAAKKMIVLK